jgi:hypothetical protein
MGNVLLGRCTWEKIWNIRWRCYTLPCDWMTSDHSHTSHRNAELSKTLFTIRTVACTNEEIRTIQEWTSSTSRWYVCMYPSRWYICMYPCNDEFSRRTISVGHFYATASRLVDLQILMRTNAGAIKDLVIENLLPYTHFSYKLTVPLGCRLINCVQHFNPPDCVHHASRLDRYRHLSRSRT